MAKKLKLAEGISKPLVINSDYSRKTDVKLTKDGTSTGKQLFFGIRKNNSIDNELDDTYNKYIPSDPYIEDCVVHLYNSPYSNGKSIVYNLSENTTGSTRLITFKYNGTVLFEINQNPKELTYNSENVYICVVPSISETPKNIWLFAKFSDSLPRPDADYKTMTEFDSSYTGDEPGKKYNGRTLYFSEHTLPARKTLKELKESNILTAIHENTTFTANTNYDTDIPYHLVQVNRTDANTPYNTLSDKSEAFKKEYLMCSIGSSNTVGHYQHKPKFNVFDNSYYYGIYKYNAVVTPTIKSEDIYIVGFSITGSHSLYLFDSTCISNFTDNAFKYSAEMSVYQPIVGDTTTNCKYIYYWSNNTIPGLNGTKVSDCLDNLNKLEGTGNLSNYNDVHFTHFSGKVNQKGTSQRKTVSLNDNINVFTHENGEYKHKCTINFGNINNMYNLGKWRYTYTV